MARTTVLYLLIAKIPFILPVTKKRAARTAPEQMKKRPQRGLNFIMVRETGLEPARRKAYAPKAYVYTNFTTRAALLL